MENNIFFSLSEISKMLGKGKSTLHEHIQKIYADKELDRKKTFNQKRVSKKEGKKVVTRDLDTYSIEVVMSLLYRIKSRQAREFRMWATSVLKIHYLKALKARK